MNACDFKSDIRFERVQKTVPSSNQTYLDLYTQSYISQYDQMPRIDEIQFADSRNLMKQELEIKNTNSGTQYTTVEKLFDVTKTSSIEEAIQVLNKNLYPDLETDILQIGENVMIFTRKRNAKTEIKQEEKVEVDRNLDSLSKKELICDMLYDLSKFLGINFKTITSSELQNEPFSSQIPDAHFVNAFIYQNDVYINVDNAKFDAPIHEMSHILIGNIRYIDESLYTKLLEYAQNAENIAMRSLEFPNRTQNDILEEILVDEFSKYLSGYESVFDSMNASELNNIQYHMIRCLDTMLSGEISVRKLNQKKIGQKSIYDLAELVNAYKFHNDKKSSVDVSSIHRMVNNEKSRLLENGELIENCV